MSLVTSVPIRYRRFSFFPATILPQRIWATRRADIVYGPSRSTREGGPKPRTKLQLSLPAMINCLAEALMKSLGATVDPVSEPDVEAAWSAEIERRLVEIDTGTVELIPWDDVRSELFDDSEWREHWH